VPCDCQAQSEDRVLHRDPKVDVGVLGERSATGFQLAEIQLRTGQLDRVPVDQFRYRSVDAATQALFEEAARLCHVAALGQRLRRLQSAERRTRRAQCPLVDVGCDIECQPPCLVAASDVRAIARPTHLQANAFQLRTVFVEVRSAAP
jgi:hypothetical protein